MATANGSPERSRSSGNQTRRTEIRGIALRTARSETDGHQSLVTDHHRASDRETPSSLTRPRLNRSKSPRLPNRLRARGPARHEPTPRERQVAPRPRGAGP